MEKDFDEVDGQNDGDKLIEGDIIIFFFQETEVVVDDVMNFVLIETQSLF